MSCNISLFQNSVRGGANSTFIGVTSRAAFNAGFYALASYTFTVVNPAVAALFGVASSLARTGIRALLEKDNYDGFNSSMAKSAFIFGTSAAAAGIFTDVIGLPITFSASVGLTTLLWVVHYIGCIGKITE